MSSLIHALEIQTPRAFVPLLRPSRYKGAWGGRGSGKSHFFAELMIERAIMEPGFRGVCLREIQKSIARSAKQLLEDKIEDLNAGRHFDVQRDIIRTPGNGNIIFQGLQNHTADSIKSLEGYKVAWIEEAQSVSARSLELLRPTMRERDSEIWASWNPEKDDDPIDTLLRGDDLDPAQRIVVEANWRDNPWFPDVLEDERQSDLRFRPDEYDHIWEGGYVVISAAQIFRNRVTIEAFDPPNEQQRLHFGADWGFAVDPTTLIRSWIKDDCLYIDHEAYGVGIELDDTAALFDRVPASRDWPIKADNSRPETISYMRRQGFNISAAAKWPGSVEDGVQHLKAFRQIIVHPRCERTAKELRLYSYKVDKRNGDVLPLIADAYNHCIDAIRYGLDGFIQSRGGLGVWARLAD